MDIEIRPEYPGQAPEVITHIEGVSGRLRGLLSEVMREAVETGRKVAEAQAPRGQIFNRNEGRRISDAIQIERSDLSIGGAGGGSAYTTYRLSASSAIAPHLRYVMEGTADKGEGFIYPARGNVFPIQKAGEGVHFRKWVRGQVPQTAWWEDAHYAVEAEISDRLRGLDFGNF